jgi:hypothetical protein
MGIRNSQNKAKEKIDNMKRLQRLLIVGELDSQHPHLKLDRSARSVD